MASGGSVGPRVGVVAAVGCVVVAVVLAASGTQSGGGHGARATSGKGSVITIATRPAPAVGTDPATPAAPAVDPEASPEATSSDPVPAATPPAATTPAVLPTEALPAEVAQSLADLAAQLSQAGDDGRPPEMTREEVTDLLDAQLQSLGIQL